MRKALYSWFAVVLAVLLAGTGLAFGAQVKGQIQGISRKAQAIQVKDLKTSEDLVINFDDATRLVNAKSIGEFIVNDKVVVEFEPGKPATSIKRVLIELPADKVIGLQQLLGTINSGKPYTLVDSRPALRYDEGHIPTAISVPVSGMKQMWDKFPADKDRLLIFYCGGPT